MQNPYPYFHQTARYVLLEYQRQNRRRILGFEDLNAEDEPAFNPLDAYKRAEEKLHAELGLTALRECRKKLRAADLELFDSYNAAVGKNKKHLHEQLAAELGKTQNALKIVVSRLRKKLIECAKKKLAVVLN